MKKKVTSLYMLFGVILAACILISNTVASKMVQVGPWVLTAGVLVFPLTYILDNLITEVYGFAAARFTMWCSFGMNLLMVVVYMLAIAWPAPTWYENAEAFATTLGNTPRLLVASLISFIAGSYINSTVLVKMKKWEESRSPIIGKGYAKRAILSTLLGQIVDSLIFIPIGFIGTMPGNALIQMIILQVAFKTGYEAVILPFESMLVLKVRKYEGEQAYSYDGDFGLFGKKV
jgi:uncharacterized integral membrane protein (TIGR00697 family)